jgi:hypothetical protein
MWLRALAILLSSLALGRSSVALAVDYTEPVVPPQFLIVAPPAPQPAASGIVRLLREGSGGPPAAAGGRFGGLDDPSGTSPPAVGGVDVAWSRTGAPGVLQVIPHDQWSEGGGCAIWSWATC